MIQKRIMFFALLASVFLGTGIRAQDDIKKEFERRLSAIDQSDVAQLLDLADWANDNRLKASAAKLYEKVLSIEPDNGDAHKALGHRFEDGKWMTLKEYREWRRKQKASAKPEEKKEDKPGKNASNKKSEEAPSGKIELPAVDISEAVAKNAEDDQKEAKDIVDMLGVDFAVATSQHFSIKAQKSLEEIKKDLVYCEQVYTSLCNLFGQPLDKPVWNGQIFFYRFQDEANYLDAANYLGRKWSLIWPGVRDIRSNRIAHTKGNTFIYARNLQKYAALLTDYQDMPNEAYYSNCIGMLFAAYFNGPHAVPGRYFHWLDEGMGIFAATRYFGRNLLYRVTNARYAGASGIKDKDADSAYKLVCKEMAEGVLEEKPFAHLCRTELNDLDYKDLAKSWSLINFLVDKHREKFIQFMKEFRKVTIEPDEKPELAVDRHIDRVLKKVFDWTAEDLDKAWREYVLANY